MQGLVADPDEQKPAGEDEVDAVIFEGKFVGERADVAFLAGGVGVDAAAAHEQYGHAIEPSVVKVCEFGVDAIAGNACVIAASEEGTFDKRGEAAADVEDGFVAQFSEDVFFALVIEEGLAIVRKSAAGAQDGQARSIRKIRDRAGDAEGAVRELLL